MARRRARCRAEVEDELEVEDANERVHEFSSRASTPHSVASSDARAGTNEDAPPPGTHFLDIVAEKGGHTYKDTRAPARSANALAEAKSDSETSAMSSSTDWVHPERSRADTGATHSGTAPSAVNS